jgi:hypothetical protein
LTTATPVPESAIAPGEFEALLATEAPPVTLTALDGLKVTAKVAVCPGFNMSPVGTPLAVKPAPLTVTLETVILEFPALVNVTFLVLLLDTFTLPKLKAVELELRTRLVAPTVSVAGLLTALPTLLVTVTANVALLSDVTSAGVVYEDDVAPLMAIEFLVHRYVMGDVPDATTLNVAVCPATTVLLTGCVVIAGATATVFTVRVAAELVAVPAELDNTTMYCAVLSEVVVIVL